MKQGDKVLLTEENLKEIGRNGMLLRPIVKLSFLFQSSSVTMAHVCLLFLELYSLFDKMSTEQTDNKRKNKLELERLKALEMLERR